MNANDEIEEAEWEEVPSGPDASHGRQQQGFRHSQQRRQPSPEDDMSPWVARSFWHDLWHSMKKGMTIVGAVTACAFVVLAIAPLPKVEQHRANYPQTSESGPAVTSSGANIKKSGELEATIVNVPLEFNALAYYPAANTQCDGEMWGHYCGSDGPELVWNPEYTGPETDYNITFHYRYDGTVLHLFDGIKSYGPGRTRKERVKDRNLRLVHDKHDWLLNGKRIYECAG